MVRLIVQPILSSAERTRFALAAGQADHLGNRFAVLESIG